MGSTKANFAMPQNMVLDEATATEKYGKFVAEPFEKGFGHTLGNAMRRVLLHSLEGVAVTWIKIDGVLHEYAQAKDVVEDITDVVLNFKQVRFKTEGEVPRKLELRANKKGAVTAADIVSDGMIEVLNPEQIICTLGDLRPPIQRYFSIAETAPKKLTYWVSLSSSMSTKLDGSTHPTVRGGQSRNFKGC